MAVGPWVSLPSTTSAGGASHCSLRKYHGLVRLHVHAWAPAPARFALANPILGDRRGCVRPCREEQRAEAQQSGSPALAGMDDVQKNRQPLYANDGTGHGRACIARTAPAILFPGPARSFQLPRIQSVVYSLDALLPIMEIGQKQYWRPDTAKPNGMLTLNYYYFLSVIGWALSLLAVAGPRSLRWFR